MKAQIEPHVVDLLMGRDGDPLLAIGTRAMWIALVDAEREKARTAERAAIIAVVRELATDPRTRIIDGDIMCRSILKALQRREGDPPL